MKKVGEASSLLSIAKTPLSSSDSKVIVNASVRLEVGNPISKNPLELSFPVLASVKVWFEFENPVIIYFAEAVELVPSVMTEPLFLDIDTKSPSRNPCSTKSNTSVVKPDW